MLAGLSLTIVLLAALPAMPQLFRRYQRRRSIVTGLARLENWVGQQHAVAIAESRGLWVSRAGRSRRSLKRKSRAARVGRAVRRIKQVWAELDYAQRRSVEIRTGVPMLKQSQKDPW